MALTSLKTLFYNTAKPVSSGDAIKRTPSNRGHFFKEPDE